MPERSFVHRLRVRYGECDPQGWVFNANYLMYFDVGLTELWREALGPYNEMIERSGVDMVVAEATIRYLAPARFDEELDVALRIERLGDTSMTTAIAVSNDAGPVVEGRMRHVFISVNGEGKVAMPDWIRDGLRPYAE